MQAVLRPAALDARLGLRLALGGLSMLVFAAAGVSLASLSPQTLSADAFVLQVLLRAAAAAAGLTGLVVAAFWQTAVEAPPKGSARRAGYAGPSYRHLPEAARLVAAPPRF